MSNNAITACYDAPSHPLEELANTTASADTGIPKPQNDPNWAALSTEKQFDTLACIDVDLDDFISVLKGGPQEQTKMTQHIFAIVDKAFHPNTPEDTHTHHKEPISVRNLCQGDVSWPT